MNPYYTAMLLIGILLVIFCTVLIIYDNKKLLSYIKLADEREQQLREIVSDAELMIEELNSFSDYIVNEVEKKNVEFKNNIQHLEAEINNLNHKTEELFEILNNINNNQSLLKDEEKDKTEIDSRQSFISLNSKYSEVIRLSKEGMEETEIARKLNMGKGEVQLILQFTK
ncbi:MAG: hypothetical protein HPY74_04080 [Firmicutes bacterium]|nr:hypothetical protein [Bacillota bacterium]